MKGSKIDPKVIFPITVTWEDGTSDTYDDPDEVETTLEHFDSDLYERCSVVDADGTSLHVKVYLLHIESIRRVT